MAFLLFFFFFFFFVFLIVWKYSRDKRIVYDMSDVRKKSIKTIIQKGVGTGSSSQVLRADFTITFLTVCSQKG